jgi:hypothetical protein
MRALSFSRVLLYEVIVAMNKAAELATRSPVKTNAHHHSFIGNLKEYLSAPTAELALVIVPSPSVFFLNVAPVYTCNSP